MAFLIPTPKKITPKLPAPKKAALPAPKQTLPAKKAETPVAKKPAYKITDDGEPDPAKLQSFFGPKADEIVRMLEDKDTDGAVSMIGRTLLATVVNILPILEQNVQQSRGTKGAYQFNQTVSSIRELLADLQAAQDRGEIGHRIVERFIRPAFQDIGAQIVTGFAEIEAQAKNRMSDSEYQEFRKDTLEIIKRNLATYIRDVYEEQKKAVVQSLT